MLANHRFNGWWERQYRCLPKTVLYHEDDEFLSDGYSYPLVWAQERSGWLRRELVRETYATGTRSVLTLKGVTPRGALFVNGRFVGERDDPGLRRMADVTDFLSEGKMSSLSSPPTSDGTVAGVHWFLAATNST